MRKMLAGLFATLGLVAALGGCAAKSYDEGGSDAPTVKPYIPPGADAPGDMPGR